MTSMKKKILSDAEVDGSLSVNGDLILTQISNGILITDQNGVVSADSSIDFDELHALDGYDSQEGTIESRLTTLDGKIDQEIQDRIDDVDAEELRAKGAESDLNTAIGNEVTRATNREDAIASDLADEVSARQTAVSNEANARQQADTTLQSNITAETTRATAAETALQTAVQNEASARQSADATLTTNLASEVATRGSEITRVEGLISTEATARSNADSALSTAISNEVTRATGAEGDLQTSITALQNNKVDKTFSDSVFIGASITDRTVDGAKITFNKKDTNNNQTGTVAVSLPIASGGENGYAGLATADQIDQIIQNREDIDLLLGKSTRYAIDVDLTGMTDAQIQTALTSEWRDASGQTTGDPAQYTTLVNLWNNHEYTWLTIVTDPTTDPPTTTSQWEDRGISTVSIATSNSLGVVMGTDPDPVDHTTDGTVYVDANGQMQVNGWDDVTTDISNAKSDITGLQNTKVDKTTTVNGHPLSSNVTVTKGDVGLGNCDNTSDLNKPISTATQTALDGKADTDLQNLTGIGGTKAGGKTIVWNAEDDQWDYGEAGKVDDVKINGATIVADKIANIHIGDGLTVNAATISHDTSGVTAGTYQEVAVDQLGHVTQGKKIFTFTHIYLEEVD